MPKRLDASDPKVGRIPVLLAGTYWYCAAETVPALRTQGKDQLEAVKDQTVWYVTGERNGYYWGVGSALVTAADETPDVSNKGDFTFYGSVTPDGRVHMTFLLTTSTTIGTGIITEHRNEVAFEMQMSSGPASRMVVHWAYMLQVKEGDPEWDCLPGTGGASVPEMIAGLTPPETSST